MEVGVAGAEGLTAIRAVAPPLGSGLLAGGLVGGGLVGAGLGGAGLVGGAGKSQAAATRKRGMTAQHPLLPQHCRPDGPPADIVVWRRCRLLDAGFPEALATRLAHGRVDLHALLQLVDRGCPPELAARILAPLEILDEETSG